MSGSAALRGRLGWAGLWIYVRRSLRQHALVTAITVASTALGAGLVMAVLGVARQSEDAFAGGPLGFDAILGGRGSKLQLVLNSVFHIDSSPGNVPWSLYEEVREDPRVTRAVPYVVGDSIRGFRVVGTTSERFTFGAGPDGEAPLAFESGRAFDDGRREAVAGSLAASEAGLFVGRHFEPEHGVGEGGHSHHEEYVVTGVLAPTGGPLDRVVFLPYEGVFRLSGHVLGSSGEEYHPEPGVPIPDEVKELSAVLLKLRSYQHGLGFDHRFNKEGSEATLAWPVAQSLRDLFARLGWGVRALQLVAWLVVVVAAGSILASLVASMSARRHELAVLRALGAERRTVFAAILLESATIAALGALAGFLVHGAILFVARGVLREQTGVLLDPFAWHPAYLWTPLGLIGVGLLAGLVPAWQAYRTDVARQLG